MKALCTSILLFILLLIPVICEAQTTERMHTVRPGETLFSISREYNISVDELKSWNNIRTNTIIVGQRLIVGQPSDSGSVQRHTVRSGETLMAISRRYQVDVDRLRRVNNLRSDEIRIGQVLIIPDPEYDEGTAPSPAHEPAARPTPPPPVESDSVRQAVPQPRQPQTQQPAPDSRTADPPVREQERSLVLERGESRSTYTVRPGDTLFRIASSHNMTIDELRRLNNLRGDVISVGQQIVVRSGTTTASVGAEGSSTYGRFMSYTVTQGDNIQELLDRYHMDRVDFETLNPGTDPDRLRPGLTVTLLEPPATMQFNPYRSTMDVEDSDLTPVTRYSDNHIGRTTTNGELYNPDELTAAHASLPLGSVVFVQNPENGRGIYVLVNDRIVDDSLRLSAHAFQSLDYAGSSRQSAIILPSR